MALKSGRVGVRPDQVDVYGRLQVTDYLIDELRKKLDVEEAEVNALQQARLHYLEELQRPVITDPVIDPKPFPQGNKEEET